MLEAANANGEITRDEIDSIEELISKYRESRAGELELNQARINAAATQGEVARLQRQAERDALVEQGELIEMNIETISDEIVELRAVVDVEQQILADLNNELGHRKSLHTAAIKMLDLIELQQKLEFERNTAMHEASAETFRLLALQKELEFERAEALHSAALITLDDAIAQQGLEHEVNLEYVERERLVGSIIGKHRELVRLADDFDIVAYTSRLDRAHSAAQRARDDRKQAAADRRADPVKITVKVDSDTLVTALLPKLQHATIRGDDLGLGRFR